MKMDLQLGLCFLTLMIGSSTGEYSLNPYYSRTFGLFNLLRPQKVTISAFSSLTARVTALEISLQTLRNDFDTFRNSVNREIQSLKDAISRLGPKCPAVAGALIVNGVCLSVEGSDANPSTLKTFTAAQMVCVMKGGYLAEPSTVDTAFWNNLRAIFPSQVAGLSTKGMYVGIVAVPTTGAGPPVVDNYSYVSGATISNTASVWVGSPTPVPVAPDRAAFVQVLANVAQWLNPGTTTDLITAAGTNMRGYICQYATVV